MKVRRFLSVFAVLAAASHVFAAAAIAMPTGVIMSMSGPAAGDIDVGADDAVLMELALTSDMDITFKNFPISLQASERNPGQGLLRGTTPNFTDIKLVNTDTGDVVGTPIDATELIVNLRIGNPAREGVDSRELYHLFTDDFEIAAGETLNLALTVDVDSRAKLAGTTIVAKVRANSRVPEMRDDDNNVLPNAVFLAPSSDIQGYTMTVEVPLNPTLSVETSDDTPEEDIVVTGEVDVEVAKFEFDAENADFIVTEAELLIDPSVANNIVEVFAEYVNSDGDIEEQTAFFAGDTATVTNMDMLVEEGSIAELTVYVEVNTLPGGATAGDTFQIVLGDYEASEETSGSTYTGSLDSTEAAEVNFMHVYESKPTLSLASTSPFAGSRSVNPTDELFIFVVGADDSEDITIEQLTIDMVSDADFDTTSSVPAYLKNADDDILSTAYITFDDASNASMTFMDDVYVSAGDREQFTLEINTSTLLDDDAGLDDPVTVSIDLGSADSDGGLWWNETNETVKWCGYLEDTIFAGNTMLY